MFFVQKNRNASTTEPYTCCEHVLKNSALQEALKYIHLCIYVGISRRSSGIDFGAVREWPLIIGGGGEELLFLQKKRPKKRDPPL